MQRHIFNSVTGGRLICELIADSCFIWYGESAEESGIAALIHASEGIYWRDSLTRGTMQVSRFPDKKFESGSYYTIYTDASRGMIAGELHRLETNNLVYKIDGGPAIVDLPILSPVILRDYIRQSMARDKHKNLLNIVSCNWTPQELLRLYTLAKNQLQLMPDSLRDRLGLYEQKIDEYLLCYERLTS